jgi:hypothetical protein
VRRIIGDLLVFRDQRRFLSLLYNGPRSCAEKDLLRTSECNNGSWETFEDALVKVHLGAHCSWFHDTLDCDGVSWNSDKPRPGKPLTAPVSRNLEPKSLRRPCGRNYEASWSCSRS